MVQDIPKHGIIECEDHLSYTGDLHEAIGSHHIYLY